MSSLADTPATRIYLLEIATFKNAIAGISAEIGTDMQEIAGCSPETRISFMETAPDWSEIATDSPEIAGSRVETASRSRKTSAVVPIIGGNFHETNELQTFRLL